MRKFVELCSNPAFFPTQGEETGNDDDDDDDDDDDIKFSFITTGFDNRPFSKMVTENLNKSKLKMNTSTRKSILNLVTLPSFSISGKISADKMYVENCKNYRRLYDWGNNAYPQSYPTNVCKFYNFEQYIFSADISPEIQKLGRVTKFKMLFLLLVFNFSLFQRI